MRESCEKPNRNQENKRGKTKKYSIKEKINNRKL